LHPGFTVQPHPTRVGEQIKINYYGLLASGADQVWLHSGYGSGAWTKTCDYQMTRSAGGWEQSLQIVDRGQFNFCFKDSAGHWDNNNGMNWSYQIS
jgi:hypothetical protein